MSCIANVLTAMINIKRIFCTLVSCYHACTCSYTNQLVTVWLASYIREHHIEKNYAIVLLTHKRCPIYYILLDGISILFLGPSSPPLFF